MSSLRDRSHTLQPSAENRRGAALLADILEVAQITPEAEPIRSELLAFLHNMGKGHGFAIVPLDKELTPTQAAEVLGVSRTHFMRMVQKGDIPYRTVGTHHRVRLEDVLQYREGREQRKQALDALIEQAQDLNLGY